MHRLKLLPFVVASLARPDAAAEPTWVVAQHPQLGFANPGSVPAAAQLGRDTSGSKAEATCSGTPRGAVVKISQGPAS